jgi:hypothetical protein
MPINSGWYDSIDKIYYPEDYCRWDDLGSGANHYHTITAQNGATADANGTTFGESSTAYWKITYTNSLKLHDRDAFTIEFGINVLTDSTSTTNFQTANEGWVIAQGEDDSDTTQNWAVFVDSNNKINFRYKTGAGTNSFTSSGDELKLFNDQIEKIKITFDGTNIKLFKNDTLGVTHVIDSAGILTDTADLVIGGNSTGNYQLLNTRITELRIRKDEFTGDTLEASDQRYLIEAAKSTPSTSGSAGDKWDVNTLLYLPIASNANMKPRQLRLIPNTWGDWSRWFVAPSNTIDVTTGTVDFGAPTKGFKKITVTTTDGFLYPYNSGGTDYGGLETPSLPYWGGNDDETNAQQVHKQDGDVAFLKPLGFGTLYDSNAKGQASVTELTTTSFNVKVPSKGYLPATEKTESQALIDTTKVDSTSANAQYNQGFRPRGIKKILYQLSQEFMEERLFRNADDDAHMMGMPYYEWDLNLGTKYAGGFYSSGYDTYPPSSYYDSDFRYNEGVVHIEVIGRDSTGQAEITTRDNHELTTGDQVFVRVGQEFPTTGNNSNYYKRHSLSISRHYMVLSGKKYVRVTGDRTITLYHDSGRTNPVIISNGDTQSFFRQGYLQKSTTYGNWIQQRNRRLTNYTRPFTSKYSVGSGNNARVINYTTDARDTQFSKGVLAVVNVARDTTNPLLNIPNKVALLERGDLQSGVRTVTFKDTPTGSQSDPIVIKSISTGFTSNSVGEEGAPIYIDLDTKFTGTLKIDVSNVTTADSTTPTQVKYQYILNGEAPTTAQPFNTETNAWGSQFYDTNLTTNTETFGTTIEIPVTAATGQDQDPQNRVLYSVALKVWLPDVVHTSDSDITDATYTIYFENNAQAVADGAPVRLFYGSGLQPGVDMINTERYISQGFQFQYTDYMLHRNRHWVHYSVDETNSTPNPAVELVVKGIPYIGYTGMGDTVVVAGDVNILNAPFGGSGGQYTLPYINETVTSVPAQEYIDVAPWVEQTAQTVDEIRVYRGQRYQCQTTHTSGKSFEQDFDEGLWTLL